MDGKANANPLMVFLTCQQIEKTCSSVYREFARLYSQDAQARALFQQLAAEEEEHAAQFELLYSINMVSPVTVLVELSYAGSALRAMENCLEQVKAARRLPLQEALRLSVKAEEQLQVFHARLAAEVRNEEWHALLAELQDADLDHAKKLIDFQRLRGLAP